MTLEERISSFSSLGEQLRVFAGQPDQLHAESRLQAAINAAEKENPWFTRNVIMHAIRYWGNSLHKPGLNEWLEPYQPAIGDERPLRRVGVVMAGNIPMVGFHDLLCVLLTGNHLVARLSSQDASLIPVVTEMLVDLESSWRNRIELTTAEIEQPEAILATGSNNTSRYFGYYFGKYPHIIRKNRTGVAVLDGRESEEELRGIASDIFTYFGLGCRNVSKLYLPQGYDFGPLHTALSVCQDHFHHPKYRNNLDYYKSIYLVNRTRFIDGGFYLMVENEQLATPVSVIHYEYYRDPSSLVSLLNGQRDQIQCVVARNEIIPGTVAPGETQQPALSDYPDGVDTLAFLLKKFD
ncbi:MAG: acyl-CoA reductase [Bacteroidetes bacterium]|nr:MAG: acyl-CoA reductase [Bacteroidota bacterium]